MKIQALSIRPSTLLSPYFSVPVPAGYPQVVEQNAEYISIDEYLRSGSEAVGFVRVFGDSMVDNKINHGDLLVVEKTEHARSGDVVIAEVNGEFTVKRLKQHSHGLYLVPANDAYPIRQVKRTDNFTVWAKVKHVIHSF